MRVPLRLGRDPLIEAVIELRFAADQAASELLPGLLVSHVTGLRQPARLPIAEFPREIQEADATLRYLPRLSLQGDGYVVLVGDRVLNIGCGRPYLGWGKFRPIALGVLDALQQTGIVKQVERLSTKYVNVIEAPDDSRQQFELIKFEARLGDRDLLEATTTHVHTETSGPGIIKIVDVKTRSSANPPKGDRINGLLVSVDTICTNVDEFWNRKEEILDDIHMRTKETFFSLLTDTTIEALDPTWE